MRVIAGTYRRRVLQEADRTATRATTDKNRETVFNILGQYFPGGRCLDLFAGTGAMGIEALSRGMDAAVFVDNDPIAVRTIHANLRLLGIGPAQATVHPIDALAFLRRTTEAFDLVVLDPPYAAGLVEEAIRIIGAKRLVLATGILVAEADRHHDFKTSEGGFALTRVLDAGNSRFAFYRWGDPQ